MKIKKKAKATLKRKSGHAIIVSGHLKRKKKMKNQKKYKTYRHMKKRRPRLCWKEEVVRENKMLDLRNFPERWWKQFEEAKTQH